MVSSPADPERPWLWWALSGGGAAALIAAAALLHGADAVYQVANLLIVAGCLLVPFTVLVRMPLTTPVRVAGAVFFLTCAMTHLATALGIEHTRGLVVTHAVQAVAVLTFVLGFDALVRAAQHRAAADEDLVATDDLSERLLP